MPSSYPGAADSFGAPAGSDPQSTPVGGRTHSQSHTDLGDAVEAIETELGLNPSGAAATVAARLDAHDASTSPHIPAGAVSGSGAVGAVKWDESVGRRCFAWDTVNSRWQMIYGDTGWRDIAASSIGTPPVEFTIVRSMWRVECRAYNMHATSEVPIPVGFRPCDASSGSAYPVGTASVGAMLWNAGTSRFVPSGAVAGYLAAFLYWSYVTADAWPAVLPGVASSGIPSA